MKPIDGSLLAAVRPECWYAVADVARLFGRTEATAADWLRERGGRPPKLASVPDPMDPRRRVVSGAVILARAGGLLIEAAPAPSESEGERLARARRAAEECRMLAGGGAGRPRPKKKAGGVAAPAGRRTLTHP